MTKAAFDKIADGLSELVKIIRIDPLDPKDLERAQADGSLAKLGFAYRDGQIYMTNGCTWRPG